MINVRENGKTAMKEIRRIPENDCIITLPKMHIENGELLDENGKSPIVTRQLEINGQVKDIKFVLAMIEDSVNATGVLEFYPSYLYRMDRDIETGKMHYASGSVIDLAQSCETIDEAFVAISQRGSFRMVRHDAPTQRPVYDINFI